MSKGLGITLTFRIRLFPLNPFNMLYKAFTSIAKLPRICTFPKLECPGDCGMQLKTRVYCLAQLNKPPMPSQQKGSSQGQVESLVFSHIPGCSTRPNIRSAVSSDNPGQIEMGWCLSIAAMKQQKQGKPRKSLCAYVPWLSVSSSGMKTPQQGQQAEDSQLEPQARSRAGKLKNGTNL